VLDTRNLLPGLVIPVAQQDIQEVGAGLDCTEGLPEIVYKIHEKFFGIGSNELRHVCD
jgi:hypothetical protein